MIEIKQLVIFLITLSLSLVAVSGTLHGFSDNEISPESKWFLNGYTIYDSAGHSNSAFATGPINKINQTAFVADHDFEWGAFKVSAGYEPSSGTTYWIDWFRAHNEGKTYAPHESGPFTSPFGDTFSTLTDRQSSKVNQITLQIANTYSNTHTNITIHVGIQVVALNTANIYSGIILGPQRNNMLTDTENSNFKGAGGLGGINLEQLFDNPFSIFWRNQFGLVYGKLTSNIFDNNSRKVGLSTENKYLVLPTLNIEMGGSYTPHLDSIDLRIEAGVRGAVIVDGIQNYRTETMEDLFNWTNTSVFVGAQVSFSKKWFG